MCLPKHISIVVVSSLTSTTVSTWSTSDLMHGIRNTKFWPLCITCENVLQAVQGSCATWQSLIVGGVKCYPCLILKESWQGLGPFPGEPMIVLGIKKNLLPEGGIGSASVASKYVQVLQLGKMVLHFLSWILMV